MGVIPITNRNMKHSYSSFILVLALALAPLATMADDKDQTNPDAARYNVTDSNGQLAFGMCYYEVDGRPSGAHGNFYSPDHTDWSMKSWPDANKHVVSYIHFPACQTNAQLQLTTTGAVTFTVTVTCMEDKSQIATKNVTLQAGTDQWVTVMDSKSFPQDAWYKFDILCTSGAANVGEIKYWKFSKPGTVDKAYTADYMSSPSAHLNGWYTTDPTKPAANRYDWLYNEVMMPAENTIVGTYIESMGILGGYTGIQCNGDNNHDIIFSMWDAGNTDTDPNLPDYLRSGSLDGNNGVGLSRFGGEGTGGKAFRSGEYWVPGQWVKFLVNARPEVVTVETASGSITYTNTLVTVWYKTEGGADNINNAEEGEDQYDGWHYLATHRKSGGNEVFDGISNSFLEDYNWPSGQWVRAGYYARGGMRSVVDGKWYHANAMGGYGRTDGGTQYGKRNDVGHDATSVDGKPAFYMYSGGYTNACGSTQNKVLPLEENFNPVPQTTLDKLFGRVEKAIQKEQQRKMSEEFDTSRTQLSNSGFSVKAVSSEANNEGANNVRTALLDGDESTYWHTKWSSGSGSSNYAYTVDIEVSEALQSEQIEQILLYQGRATTYRAKSVEVYTSNDYSTWAKVGDTFNLEDIARPQLNLSSVISGKKYIRLNFLTGYGQYLVINEIYFRTAPSPAVVNDIVEDILANENHFNGYSSSDLTNLKNVYKNGAWTSADAVREALADLAANGTLLKYGIPAGVPSISSFKAYQLYNAKGLGNLVVKTDAPAVEADAAVNVTLDVNNWQILRSEKWNAYYLYNIGTGKYLSFTGGVATLSTAPVPVQVSARTSGGKVEGYTFQFDATDSSSFLTASGTSATLGASNTDGALWQLRDNYSLTPESVTVAELLEEANEKGAPSGLNGEAYSIRLGGTDLYLSTAEVADNSNKTYSLSVFPEYFKLKESGSGFTLQSATTGKYVGTGSNSWDCGNAATVWTIAHIDGQVTTILKSGNQGLGVDSETSGSGVFTNKTTKNQWVFALYEQPEEETSLEFVDGQEYTSNRQRSYAELTYTRTFNNTNWQALYIPFSLSSEEWESQFDIAEIHNFIEYDDNDDGTFDRTYLVVLNRHSGNTDPNYPYLIRAKATGTYTLTLSDKTLQPAQNNSVDCRSVKNLYTFTGTYQPVTTMYANGYYALSAGALNRANSADVKLGAQRWYMEITPRSGGYSSVKMQTIQIVEEGEENIAGLTTDKHQGTTAFDLVGRKVLIKGETGTQPHGVTIVGGKKVIR